MSDWNENTMMNDHMQNMVEELPEYMGFQNQHEFNDIFMNDLMDSQDGQSQNHQNHQNHQNQRSTNENILQYNSQNQRRLDRIADSLSPNELLSSPMLNGATTNNNNNNNESFTPLMSPSTTPLEHPNLMANSQMSEFTIPGAYFSPTTSPMIEASSHNNNNNNHHNRRASSSSTGRWRAGNTPILPAQGTGRVSKQAVQPKQKRKVADDGSNSTAGNTPGSDSVSPEELTEISMPPPQRVISNSSSSATATKTRNASTSSTASTISQPSTPATPASLMNLPPGETNQSNMDERIQNAIRATTNNTKPATTKVKQRSGSASLQSSPRLNALKSKSGSTPRISPNIKPKISPSPTLSPRIVPSPSGSHHSTNNNNNNSNSTYHNSNHHNGRESVSSASDLSALLASKSNYQNIVEGNHNQLGLSYPEQLSADLTSKKTSHKLAEQGRRNRINVALQELGELVAEKAGGHTPSKATTVETAIKYIKDLQDELDVVKKKLHKYESS